MVKRVSRLVRILALSFATVLVASSCASSSAADPITIDGVAIPTDVIADELAVLDDHPEFAQILLGQDVAGTGSTQDRMSSATASRLVSRRALIQVSDNELAARNAAVTDAEATAEQANLDSLLGETFSALPEDYKGDLARGEASRNKLAGLLAADQDIPIPASPRDVYDANPDAFTESCTRHILVNTEDEALAALDRLDDGEDFGEVAAELSQDSTAENGGQLPCYRAGSLVPEYAAVAFTAEPGVVNGPVQTQFGFHLIIVDSLGPVAYEDVADELGTQYEQERNSALNAAFGQWLDGERDSIDVVVDPRYGTWDADRFVIASPSESAVTP